MEDACTEEESNVGPLEPKSTLGPAEVARERKEGEASMVTTAGIETCTDEASNAGPLDPASPLGPAELAEVPREREEGHEREEADAGLGPGERVMAEGCMRLSCEESARDPNWLGELGIARPMRTDVPFDEGEEEAVFGLLALPSDQPYMLMANHSATSCMSMAHASNMVSVSRDMMVNRVTATMDMSDSLMKNTQ